MTMTIQFDTMRYVEKLKTAGMSEAHAKASAEALSTALEQSTSTTFATKVDVSELKEGINDLRHEFNALRNDMKVMKSEVRADIVQVRSDLKVMQWMTGTIVVGVVSLVAKSFF